MGHCQQVVPAAVPELNWANAGKAPARSRRIDRVMQEIFIARSINFIWNK